LIAPTLQRFLTFQVPNIMSFFNCLGRAKESVQVRSALKHFLTWYIFTARRSCPTPNHQSGGPPLVGCPRLLNQYIRSYSPYLEAFSSVRNLRTLHAMVTRDPPNMEMEVQLCVFLTLALYWDGWSAPRYGRFNIVTHWLGGWQGPMADLDFVTIPATARKRTPDLQSVTKSLYWPRY
jgi:hypothetical protein